MPTCNKNFTADRTAHLDEELEALKAMQSAAEAKEIILKQEIE